MNFTISNLRQNTEIFVIKDGQQKTFLRFKDIRCARLFNMHIEEYHFFCFGCHPVDHFGDDQEAAEAEAAQ